jgi:acyl carrier protein
VPEKIITEVVETVTEPTLEAIVSSGTDTSQLEKMLLDVVSEKTGYPAEMLELSMDMEADLGIDSIKRVEIFGALTKQYPEMGDINPNELTELRTLGEIVSYVAPKGTADVTSQTVSTPVVVQETKAAPIQEVITAPVTEEVKSSATDTSQLEKMLLDVVSEKTGYPAEMLELSMDMEADLGIDSIKRVEIFGALTKQYPEMGDINPNELTELRTLGEIVSYVSEPAKKKVLA